MLKVYFVRHGETDWNAAGRLQGMTDTPLNAQGLEQAALLAARLAQEPDWAAIYSSPLRRASATAQIIAGALALTPILDPRLVERNMGTLEGLSLPEIQQRFPVFHEAWVKGPRPPAFPDEEPRAVFQQRIRSFLDDLLARHSDLRASQSARKVAVVTHGGAMGMIMATLMAVSLERRFPFVFDNASVSIAEFGGPVPRVSRLNDTCHLNGKLSHREEEERMMFDEKTTGNGIPAEAL